VADATVIAKGTKTLVLCGLSACHEPLAISTAGFPTLSCAFTSFLSGYRHTSCFPTQLLSQHFFAFADVSPSSLVVPRNTKPWTNPDSTCVTSCTTRLPQHDPLIKIPVSSHPMRAFQYTLCGDFHSTSTMK